MRRKTSLKTRKVPFFQALGRWMETDTTACNRKACVASLTRTTTSTTRMIKLQFSFRLWSTWHHIIDERDDDERDFRSVRSLSDCMYVCNTSQEKRIMTPPHPASEHRPAGRVNQNATVPPKEKLEFRKMSTVHTHTTTQKAEGEANHDGHTRAFQRLRHCLWERK